MTIYLVSKILYCTFLYLVHIEFVLDFYTFQLLYFSNDTEIDFISQIKLFIFTYNLK